MCKKLLDLRFSHFYRMTFVVKKYKMFDPADITLFRFDAVVFYPDLISLLRQVVLLHFASPAPQK